MFVSSDSGSSFPVRPISRARTNTQGLAASAIDTSIDPMPGISSQSLTRPVGNRPMVADPPGARKSNRTGAPVPATPGMARSPSVAARPSARENVERMILPVLVLKILTTAVSPFGRTMPSSTANGPTAEDMLPQLPR